MSEFQNIQISHPKLVYKRIKLCCGWIVSNFFYILDKCPVVSIFQIKCVTDTGKLTEVKSVQPLFCFNILRRIFRGGKAITSLVIESRKIFGVNFNLQSIRSSCRYLLQIDFVGRSISNIFIPIYLETMFVNLYLQACFWVPHEHWHLSICSNVGWVWQIHHQKQIQISTDGETSWLVYSGTTGLPNLRGARAEAKLGENRNWLFI